MCERFLFSEIHGILVPLYWYGGIVMSIIRDAALAEAGRMKIAWVEDYMPALRAIRSRFEQGTDFIP